MSRVITLSESDLTRIVRRIISEQEQQELVMNIVNSPKLKGLADQALSNLSARELVSMKKNLNSIGIDDNTSLSDALNAGQIAVQQSNEESELSEDEGEEKLTFVDRVKMGMSTLGLVNTTLLGGLGSSLIEKVTDYANIDTSSFTENSISFVIGIVLMLVGNTVHDKLKRIYKD